MPMVSAAAVSGFKKTSTEKVITIYKETGKVVCE